MNTVFKIFPVLFALITQNPFLIAATSNIQVSVCSLPSAPTIISPENGSTTTASSLTVSGIAEAGSTVHIVRNAVEVATITASSGGSFGASASLALGGNQLRALASNSCGTGQSSTSITVTRNNPPLPLSTDSDDSAEEPAPAEQPVIKILSPATGTITSNPAIIVRGKTSAGAKVEIVRGSKVIATILADDEGDFSLSVSLQSGSNEIYARLKLEEGDIESDHIFVTYQVPQNLSMLGNIAQTLKDAFSVVAGVVKDVPAPVALFIWISILPLLWLLIKRRLAH